MRNPEIDLALDASRIWAQQYAPNHPDPVEFGHKAALVYRAALETQAKAGDVCIQPTGPKPISPSTGAAADPRPLSLTSLDNDRTILEVGDGRVELNGCERKVLTDMLTSKERTGIEITDALLKLSPDEARSLLWSDQINHDEAKGTPVRAVPAPVPVSEHPMRPAATPEKTACVTSRFLEALVRCLTPAGVLRGSDSSETGSRLAGGEKQ